MKFTSIYTPKGGVGKTSLAFALTKELDNSYYVTNDNINSTIALHQLGSTVATTLDDKVSIPKGTDNLIFDCGGFIDPQGKTKAGLKKSNVLIIPIEYNSINIAILPQLYSDFKILNPNAKIIIVVNKFNERKYTRQEVLETIEEKTGTTHNVVFLPITTIFEAIQENNTSISKYIESFPIFRHTYRKFYAEWKKLLLMI